MQRRAVLFRWWSGVHRRCAERSRPVVGKALPLLGQLSLLLANYGALPVLADAAIRPVHVAAPPAAEDMLLVPGIPWVIVSAVSIGPEAVPGIYVVSDSPPHLEKLSPRVEAAAANGACAALDVEGFSPLGIAWRDADDGDRQLLVINRGSRKAIEIFSIRSGTRVPELLWRDCIGLLPEIEANSIAPLPGYELLVTQTADPGDTGSWAKRERGEISGQVYRWSSMHGWSVVAGSALSGPNGLVASADGCFAMVSAWSERRLLRLPLDCAQGAAPAAASMELPFLPDNLRWSSRGTVLLTGQRTTPNELLACVDGRGPCPVRSEVLEIDPSDMSLRKSWLIDAGPTLGLGTTALEVGDQIWISSILGRVIGRFDRGAAD